ncbi:MAG TPA: HD domain-containing protein [Solirubrobacteraceae bacterium]|nr:HD domain-containing protein [Solirubrobacteraceae bacterium]
MTADPHAPARFPSLVSDLPLTRSALEFASAHHEGQRREADSAPFILHPLEVAQLLRARGYGDEVIAAAALHDVVEDTDVEPAELEQRFGRTVARLVEVLTEPSSDGSYRERKARLRAAVAGAGEDALVIFAADKVAKVREMRMALAGGRIDEPDPDKLEHYEACLELLEARLPGHSLVLQLRFELETLELLPPEARRQSS